MNFSTFPRIGVGLFAFLWAVAAWAQTGPTNAPPATDNVVLTTEGKVESMRVGVDTWSPAQVNLVLKPKDRIRTALKSRATVRLTDQSILRMNQLTTMEMQPPAEAGKRSVLDLRGGSAYFYNRDQPGETQFRTPLASGAIRGTEFHLAVAENGTTTVTMLDGEVDLTNELGQVSIGRNEQGIVEPGQPPRKTAVLDAMNIIQWSLYYPGILDLGELTWNAGEQGAISTSIDAYRQGDLLKAMAEYPTNRTPATVSERIFAAALNLAVGQVDDTVGYLNELGSDDARGARLGAALREVIAAVKNQPFQRSSPPELATEWLAHSYYLQSQGKLEEALKAARVSVEKSPEFGFGWVRVAELEFSFGRAGAALEALDKGLALSPRNAQGHSLRGFLYAAQNRIDAAIESFNKAIELDGALGNAWLGRGLSTIRKGIDIGFLMGHAKEGRRDLQTAAALEPNRSVLRSYLGKAFSNEGDTALATKELDLAKRLDPNDPTSWLYSALLAQQDNRVNEGVRDLEKSQELNDNRRIFRSRLLLDQDRAVRSANLASIYRDAGMFEVSVREAARAVESDYANSSAHLFLANSYDSLRDPRQTNLRYETPWLSELLLANLLAPVGGGNLSQNISQQEYSKLFERDRIGFSSKTEYLSSGEWYENASQFGTFGRSSYSLDFEYRRDPGQRPNNDAEFKTFIGKFKQELSPKDTLFFQAIYFDAELGDLAQYYDQAAASRSQRVTEKQEPIAFLGYHRTWSPGHHTLFLAGRLHDDLERKTSDFMASTLLGPEIFDLQYRSELEGYSTEVQQILEAGRHNFILGGRYQVAEMENKAELDFAAPRAPFALPLFGAPPYSQKFDTDLQRISLYGYDHWDLTDRFRLSLGVSWDKLHYPLNTEDPPFTDEEANKEQISPKAGFTWTLATNTFFRGYYAKSLGGVSFDTSVRLEPVQIAGFTHAYRSLIPESRVGLIPGTRFQTYGLALEHKARSNTYIGIDGEILTSDADRDLGIFDGILFATPSSTTEELDYEEKSIFLTLNQLLLDEWSIGSRYRLTHAQLDHTFAGQGVYFQEKALLQQANLYLIYNHRCGFFSSLHSVWSQQNNPGVVLQDEDFWQFNVFAGYRFPRRLAEVRVGLLNITDRDYQLNPLTLYNELPRERTFYASLKLNF